MSIRTSTLMHLELLFNHEKRRAAASKELRALRSFFCPPPFLAKIKKYHNFNGNVILQSIIAFSDTFKDLMEPVFNQALKAGHVGFCH